MRSKANHIWGAPAFLGENRRSIVITVDEGMSAALTWIKGRPATRGSAPMAEATMRGCRGAGANDLMNLARRDMHRDHAEDDARRPLRVTQLGMIAQLVANGSRKSCLSRRPAAGEFRIPALIIDAPHEHRQLRPEPRHLVGHEQIAQPVECRAERGIGGMVIVEAGSSLISRSHSWVFWTVVSSTSSFVIRSLLSRKQAET